MPAPLPVVQSFPTSGYTVGAARGRRGFALLITITLVAFLVLLLVSIATFTRVETRVATNHQQIQQARQNALFGMNLALGRVQQLAGPDQRVTANGEVLDSTNSGNRKWTGVWDTANPTAPPAWLVSGETPNPTIAPATDVPASGYTTTDVRLVGPASADTTTSPGNGNEVIVPLQNITGNGIPGIPDTPAGTLVGRYGYWVGDEGVKVRGNLGDRQREPWFEPGSGTPAPGLENRLASVGLAQRSALELVTDGSGASIKSYLDFDPVADRLANVSRWLTHDQLSLLDETHADTLKTAERARFHDLTLWSAGVQADVARGGLKRDLTAAFEMSDADFQASDLADAGPASQRVPMSGTGNGSKYVSFIYNHPVDSSHDYHGPSWHLLRNFYRHYTQVTTPFTTPVMPTQALGPTLKNTSFESYALFYRGITTDVDRDPRTNLSIKAGSATIPTPVPTRPAFMPYLNRITLVFSLQTEDTGDTTPDGQQIYAVRVVVTPYVVLHNPYNVSLNLVAFNNASNDGRKNWGRIRIQRFPFSQLVYGKYKATAGAPEQTLIFSNLTGSDRYRAQPLSAAAYNLDSNMRSTNLLSLYLPEMTLGPGEVRVFSPNTSGPKVRPVGTSLNLDANAYYEGGYYFDRLNGYKNFFAPPSQAEKVAPVANPVGADWTQAPLPPEGDPDRHRILVPGNMPIRLKLTGTSNATGAYTTEMSVRLYMDSNDNITIDGDSAAYSDLHILPLGMGSSIADQESRVYSGYGAAYDFETPTDERPAADYATEVPTPVCAYDIYVKPADQTAEPARAFVTTNPLAPVTTRNSVGNLGTASGYPMADAVWQPRYRRLPATGNAWSQNAVFAVDPDGSGRAYWGSSNTDAGLQNVSLLQVPIRPLDSIARFQHLMISLHGHEPLMAVGNSFATPYTAPTAIVENTKIGSVDWWNADVSYLANEALWDSSFFSTLAPGYDSAAGAYYTGTNPADPDSRESIRDAWLAGTDLLPNTRVRPYVSPDRDDATRRTQLLDHRQAAGNLLVDGAFNINSRSVEAWTAVLGGARKSAMVKTDGTTVSVGNDTAMPHALPSVGGVRGTDDGNWNGFATLTDTQIRALATALVARIAQRQSLDGRPFLSLAEFVNRRIVAPADPVLNAKGVLQAAIDDAGLNGAITGTDVTAALQADFPYPSQGTGSTASAASGYLLQADVLQQIGPFLSARSDTFTIRSYGESVDPLSGSTEARAWCEAVVQRVPDYVDPSDAPSVAPASLNAENQRFGRRFRLVSFRWLDPSDI